MFARQMGKNELSAQIEAYLLALYAGRGGSIVKAAPSFKPQIVTSLTRLRAVLDTHPLTRERWQPAYGYMLGVGRAACAFFSADPHANVVGATASLLLEIDEAQDVAPDKYDREFRPMASSTNATTVLYGTAWSDDSLLERMRRYNLTHHPERHFEYDWTHLASINPAYDAFVRAEIGRLGGDHPSIKTQYLLRPLSDAGKLFSAEQRRALQGDHPRLLAPAAETYVAGIDVAGKDEEAEDATARRLPPRHDATVITIARVRHDASGQARAEIVAHRWWTGRDQVWQYEELLRLWDEWQFAGVCVDASGIGRGLAEFLETKKGERVELFVFTSPSKSRLAYDLLAMINTGRICAFRHDHSPESTEFWREIEATRYHLRAGEILAWEVPPAEGHDDFVVALALCARAALTLAPPAAGGLVRAQPDDHYGGW